jgi:hypothetical protein
VEPNVTIPQDPHLRWNETRFLSCWSPESDVGLFLHVGRLRGHLDFWWSQIGVYLPDGGVAVDRLWGRDGDLRGISTNLFRWLSIEPGERMECHYDGVCEKTTPEQLMTAPRGASGPSLPIRWSLEGKAHTPLWDLHGHVEEGPDWAGSGHTEQSFAIEGTIEIGGGELVLRGHAVDDHSNGIRDFSNFGANDWYIAAMPTGSLHWSRIFDRAGHVQLEPGVLVDRSGATEPVKAGSFPELENLLTHERTWETTIVTEGGEKMPLTVERLHTYFMTITEDNDNINGLDWEIAGDPVFFLESPVRLTTSSGESIYGHLERSARRSWVDRDKFDVHRGGDSSTVR